MVIFIQTMNKNIHMYMHSKQKVINVFNYMKIVDA